jgi:acetylornithine deacetylase/succinyl-diaminopimelate desuccinylase-like protein
MQHPDLTQVYRYVDQEAERLIQDLCDLLAQPSISAQDVGMRECAHQLAAMMGDSGIASEVLPTGGYPVVYGELRAGDDLPTLAIYGHYDVQPPEPLELWKTPPFQPTRIGDYIYARAATDDKGNLVATFKAVEALLRTQGSVPLNVKFFFEGEEEIGSPSLEGFLRSYRDRLAGADATILCDRGIHESGRPHLFLGNKGMIKLEIRLQGPKRDVHSSQAPIMPSPAWELVNLLHQVKPDGRTVAIPGFYDQVVQPTAAERELIEGIPFSVEEYKRDYGLDRLLMEGTPSAVLTELLYKPTFNIQGIFGGYTGPGTKTILPATATAKIDVRLVHAMTAEDTIARIKAFFAERGYEANLEILGETEEYKLSPENPVVQAAIRAARRAYGLEPVVWPMLEGSGPLALFPEILGTPAFIIGLGAPFSTANTHAPNENVGVHHYLTGIKMMATLYALYGANQAPETTSR